mgnify:CR=1 FL=1
MIDQLKFDLRLYVLITSGDPLFVYLYKDVVLINKKGMARFATEFYKNPSYKN